MKNFINGKKPLLSHHYWSIIISNFREKADIFNDFFVQQCHPIANNSILPTNKIFYTQNRLRDFDIDNGKILKLNNGLNPHKARAHDGIS